MLNERTSEELNAEAMAGIETKYGKAVIEEIERTLRECNERSEAEQKDIDRIVNQMTF